jgi:hypothetical protein
VNYTSAGVQLLGLVQAKCKGTFISEDASRNPFRNEKKRHKFLHRVSLSVKDNVLGLLTW